MLPAAVTTAEVRFGKTTDILGVAVLTSVSIVPSHDLTWAATGERITAFEATATVDSGTGIGTVQLPHTDQPGFIDAAGNAITNWWYSVNGVDLRGSKPRHVNKRFQLPTGVDEVDLNLLPSNGTIQPVGIAPVPTVTSVNGQVGEVIVTAPEPPVTSVNGEVGDVLVTIPDPPVTSVNGQVGNVILLNNARPRVGFIGDSITKGTDTVPANHGYQDSPGVYAMLASDGRWTLVTNTGAAANTSAAILARLQADIIDKGVTLCVVVSCSWNDIAAGFTVEQTVANFEAIIDTLLAANIQPVIAEVTPDGRTGSTPERLLAMELRNRAYLSIAGERGVPVVAFFNDLVDVATGTLSIVNNADGSVHPNAAGYKRMGDKIAAVLATILPPRASGHITYASDPTDLLGGAGLFRTDTTPANGVGDGWQDFGGAGSTPSIIGGAPKGNYQRWTLSGAEERFVYRDIPAAVGDVIELSGYITQSSSARGRVRLEAIGAPTPYEESYVHLMAGTSLTASSPFTLRLTMPAGTTGARVSLCPMSGTGNLDFAQVAARNLTALGTV